MARKDDAWRETGAPLHRRLIARHTSHLSPTAKGMLWTSAAGLLFCVLNMLLRKMAMELDPFQAQFLRYLFGFLVMAPLIFRSGFAAFLPTRISGQFVRGGVHAIGLCLWFFALPKIPLADMTAIGFTSPIFIMLGAAFFFKEAMRWDRWFAALLGFAGVVMVVAPKLSGAGGVYNLVMLASAPMFAASFLITKALTRYESAQVIVLWQALTVTIFSLPMALLHWQNPSAVQWFTFVLAGMLGSAGHYCLTRSFAAADISATQSVKFLDLVWASLLGWLVFADQISQSTMIGGTVICGATIWIARREARNRTAGIKS
ncbi:MAG: ribN 1 [Herminiimonas sp.]|jgi:drug/metabolite transporter (DMT)-like permease|nr:ribN 1 [Herminiimonas sp.]